MDEMLTLKHKIKEIQKDKGKPWLDQTYLFLGKVNNRENWFYFIPTNVKHFHMISNFLFTLPDCFQNPCNLPEATRGTRCETPLFTTEKQAMLSWTQAPASG